MSRWFLEYISSCSQSLFIYFRLANMPKYIHSRYILRKILKSLFSNAKALSNTRILLENRCSRYVITTYLINLRPGR